MENVRLTPARAEAIAATATELRPDLAASIERAISVGEGLATSYPRASLPKAGASDGSSPLVDSTPYPGGNPSIPLASLSEYQRNYSLDAMHVDAALAQGYTGKGVVVGVIDTGIDKRPDGSNHPEFGDRIDPRSKSYLYWFDHDIVCTPDQSTCPVRTDQEILAAFDQGPTDSMDQDGHGTHVSGIVGAGQNGFGMQGVAPRSTLLAVKAISQDGVVHTSDGDFVDVEDLEYCGPDAVNDQCNMLGGYGAGSTKAFTYLSQFPDVKVINGSFGPDEDPGATTWDLGDAGDQQDDLAEAQAMRKNLDAGQIIVMAAGNARTASPILSENPIGAGLYPFLQPANEDATNSSGALIYDDHGTGIDMSFTSANALAAAEEADGKPRGRIVVVVATDAYNQLAAYSQMCGVAKEWCIAAPGGNQTGYYQSNYQAGDRGIYSTFPQGATPGNANQFPTPDGYALYQGTSMAAPNVAGAVAVLIEAYPTFTPAEIVQLMFMTAQDLGAPGVDAIYGWGLVRLDRALAAGPVGMTGSGVYTVGAGGSNATWVVDFTSAGALEKTGSGTLDVESSATFETASSVTGGLMVVDGRFTTPTLTVGTGGTLGGTGTVAADLDVAGTLAPGNSPGTLSVVGDVTLSDTATTEIEIDGPGTGNGAGNYDRILVYGSGSVFTAGGTLEPKLRGISGSATNTFVPSLGEAFVFVQTPDGRVAGSFAALTQPASGLPAGTRFDVLYDSDALSLAATPARYADLAALGIDQSENETALGGAIDAARPAAGVRPDAADNALYNLLYTANEAELASGFASLTGQIHAEMATTAVRAVGRFADTLANRQLGIAADWLSAEGTPYGTGRVWASGSSTATDVGTAGVLSGYDVRATTGAFGLDWRFDAGAVGFAGSYEQADVTADANGSGDVTTYQGALYGTMNLGPAALALRGGLGYGDLSTSRQTALGGYSATANADGHGIGGFAEASVFHAFETPAVTITPSATLGYRGFHRDEMDETGSLFALSVPGQSFDETQTTLAVALSHRFALANGMVIEPVASAGWRHDFGDPVRSSDVGLLGETFTVDGAEVGADAFLGRVSLNAVASDRVSLGASYQAEIRDNLTSHVFGAEAAFRF